MAVEKWYVRLGAIQKATPDWINLLLRGVVFVIYVYQLLTNRSLPGQIRPNPFAPNMVQVMCALPMPWSKGTCLLNDREPLKENLWALDPWSLRSEEKLRVFGQYPWTSCWVGMGNPLSKDGNFGGWGHFLYNLSTLDWWGLRTLAVQLISKDRYEIILFYA